MQLYGRDIKAKVDPGSCRIKVVAQATSYEVHQAIDPNEVPKTYSWVCVTDSCLLYVLPYFWERMMSQF